VLAELVNNAVDHGILQIDSSLKNDIEGFSAYLSLRDERIAQLQENDQINIHIYTNSTTFIRVTVEDSGAGFCRTEASEQQTLSGRGLALLDALCESVERNAKGNLTTISLVRN
jgi:anti-sigma regulatory factor (Ser/Thr protein kinase)